MGTTESAPTPATPAPQWIEDTEMHEWFKRRAVPFTYGQEFLVFDRNGKCRAVTELVHHTQYGTMRFDLALHERYTQWFIIRRSFDGVRFPQRGSWMCGYNDGILCTRLPKDKCTDPNIKSAARIYMDAVIWREEMVKCLWMTPVHCLARRIMEF